MISELIQVSFLSAHALMTPSKSSSTRTSRVSAVEPDAPKGIRHRESAGSVARLEDLRRQLHGPMVQWLGPTRTAVARPAPSGLRHPSLIRKPADRLMLEVQRSCRSGFPLARV